MQTKQQALDNIVLNAKDAAKLIGKSTIWLAKLVADGFVKPGRKQGMQTLYRPADVAQGYAALLDRRAAPQFENRYTVRGAVREGR